METTSTNQNTKINNEVFFDLDDEFNELDLDNMEFKPVTDGLGFHGSDKNENILGAKKVVKGLQKSVDFKRPTKLKDLGVSAKVESSFTPHDSSLSAFYENNIHVEKPEVIIEETKIDTPLVKTQAASSSARFGAWFIDLILISFCAIVTLLSLGMLSNLEFGTLTLALSDFELAAFVGIYFSAIYIAYFSIFDLVASPGKGIIRIKVVSKKEKLGLKQTLIRSVVSLGSFPLFGLPCLLDFQSFLSDSKVVKA